MRLAVEITLNLNTEAVAKQVEKASRLAMRDTVVLITQEAVNNSPVSATYPSISKTHRKWTGNNKRSIAAEVSGMGKVEGEGQAERIVDDSKLEGAVYSTSGYGGYLETGTVKMLARPYIKPALDREFTEEKFAERVKEHLVG